ncbi:PAS domain-containing protein [Nitratireductor sp. StC3]|uniref:PAS domain-containing protein n=1 Tax=Nitratireductor sp. StC3 TaxID=2126741 RepID=UPI000D0CDEDD|nr:PAS domain-containing protein [Nitratireductor sp. StC3]PSM20172.1 PAS domain-containing protein [Nitratireductor sp. StC3]
MKLDGTIALFQYWDRLRNGRPAPRRAEIEPADIKSMLADTFILEQDSRGAAVFRLAGTRLCAAYGRELKGFAFSSLWAGRDQSLAARLAAGALREKSVSVTNFEGITQQGRSCGFELLLLPLEGGVDSPRSLGSLAPVEKPYWLGNDPILESRIDSMRIVDPDREPLFLKNGPAITVPSLVPSAGTLSSGQGAKRRRFKHLVVIEGGRDK